MVLMVLVVKNSEIVDKLHSRKERREEAVKASYIPEKVFQKSRFHMMDVIKKKLQDQVNENYNSNNQPIPSPFFFLVFNYSGSR